MGDDYKVNTKGLIWSLCLETINTCYLHILSILFWYKNLFLLFFSSWFEREEREVIGFQYWERKSCWYQLRVPKKLIFLSYGSIWWEEFILHHFFTFKLLKIIYLSCEDLWSLKVMNKFIMTTRILFLGVLG